MDEPRADTPPAGLAHAESPAAMSQGLLPSTPSAPREAISPLVPAKRETHRFRSKANFGNSGNGLLVSVSHRVGWNGSLVLKTCP